MNTLKYITAIATLIIVSGCATTQREPEPFVCPYTSDDLCVAAEILHEVKLARQERQRRRYNLGFGSYEHTMREHDSGIGSYEHTMQEHDWMMQQQERHRQQHDRMLQQQERHMQQHQRSMDFVCGAPGVIC